MEIFYQSEHLSCPYYGSSKKPLIEVAKIVKGGKNELLVIQNEIVFITEGRIMYYFQDMQSYEGVKGRIIFRPSGSRYSYEALADSIVIIFRLENPILLCQKYSIEKLCSIIRKSDQDDKPQEPNSIGTLEINSRVWYFLDGILDCVSDGLRCNYWFESKISEFLIYLRSYYTKEEIRDFFFLVLSGDTDFSEYVRLNWERFRSINEIAESLSLTRKQFTKKFIRAFGKAPCRWMQEKRARRAYNEIISTNKPFKHIAYESGFTDDTQFTRFCKREFGKTPSELRKLS